MLAIDANSKSIASSDNSILKYNIIPFDKHARYCFTAHVNNKRFSGGTALINGVNIAGKCQNCCNDQRANAVVRNNYSYSTGDVRFYKNGQVARGISIGAESYSNWSFGVHDILIENNKLEKVRGINYITETNGTPYNIVVRNNTFVNVPAPLVSLGSWATVGTATPGTAIPPTVTKMPTRTITPTKTPMPVFTITPSLTPAPQLICVPALSVVVCNRMP